MADEVSREVGSSCSIRKISQLVRGVGLPPG